MDRAHMIRGRPLQTHSEPQSEVIAGATLATSLPEREPSVLRARLAASRYCYCTDLPGEVCSFADTILLEKCSDRLDLELWHFNNCKMCHLSA